MSAPEPASRTRALLTRKGHATPAALADLDSTRCETPPGVSGSLWRIERATTPDMSPVAPMVDSKPIAKQRRRTRDPRVRVTLRLDENRHLRLRLTAAHRNQTMQDAMMDALDGYLVECRQVLMGGTCACLEGKLDPKQCVTRDAKED